MEIEVSVLDKETRDPVVEPERFPVERDLQGNPLPVEGQINEIVEGNYALFAQGRDANNLVTGEFETDVNVRPGEVSMVNVMLGSSPIGPGGIIAVDDTFTVPPGLPTLMVPPPGVLANDTVPAGVAGVTFNTTRTLGTVVPGVSGGFDYSPPTGGPVIDTFTYTVTDVDGNSATATVNISPFQVVFVDVNATPGGDGSEANPFNDLNNTLMTISPGTYVILAAGTYPGGFTIPGSVGIVGRSAGLFVNSSGFPVVASEPGAIQVVGPAGATPVIQNPGGPGVIMGDLTILRGVSINNVGGPGVQIVNADDLEVTECIIEQANIPTAPAFGSTQAGGGNGISVVDSFDVLLRFNTINGQPLGGKGIFVEFFGAGNHDIDFIGNTFQNTGEQAVDVIYNDTTFGRATFDSNVYNNVGQAGFDGIGVFATGNSNVQCDIANDQMNSCGDDGYDMYGTDFATFNVSMRSTSVMNTPDECVDAGFNESSSGMMTFGGPGALGNSFVNTGTEFGVFLGVGRVFADGNLVDPMPISGNGTFRFQNNTISSASRDGVFVRADVDAGTPRSDFLVQQCQITAAQDAFHFSNLGLGPISAGFAFYDNTGATAGLDGSLGAILIDGLTNYCAAIDNNDSAAGGFDNSSTGTAQIEELGTLTTRNAFGGMNDLMGTTPVGATDCGISRLTP